MQQQGSKYFAWNTEIRHPVYFNILSKGFSQ